MQALRLSSSQLARHLEICLVKRRVEARSFASRRHGSMSAWTISDSLDNPSEVELKDKLNCIEKKIPPISAPSEVLVKVHATSVNPLDVRMCYGYGEVVASGPSAKSFKPGDLVFGSVEPYRSGAHAEFVTVPSYCVTRKPENLSHSEAASIPFVALTAHSALCSFGGLSDKNCAGKSVLVLGGSGGVGSFAIQLLKLWGANVTATCSEEKIDYLENTLFVEQAIDYNDLLQMDSLKHRFDFVLDCGDYESTSKAHDEIVGNGADLLRPYSQSVYVTLSPPILKNIDQHGLIMGAAETAIAAVQDTLLGLRNLNSARWAVYLPNKQALQYVSSLYEEQALTPQIHSEFAFDKMPGAYEELQSGKARGKVIVDVTKRAGASSQHGSSTAKKTDSAAG